MCVSNFLRVRSSLGVRPLETWEKFEFWIEMQGCRPYSREELHATAAAYRVHKSHFGLCTSLGCRAWFWPQFPGRTKAQIHIPRSSCNLHADPATRFKQHTLPTLVSASQTWRVKPPKSFASRLQVFFWGGGHSCAVLKTCTPGFRTRRLAGPFA